ncbi:MAG TPA: FAD-dependent oxidoreductase [Clostridiales bacterium]|nr:FAD-dependent oxidoreductase [Clostridiales bacterium]
MADDGQVYDVLVIGGGITGAFVARDCALRGLRTALVERDDFGSGTTGTCMGMLHGGLQYLLSNPELTRVECAESGIMQKAAPHLVFAIPFIFVIDSEDKVDKFEAFMAYYDQFQEAKFGRPHVTLTHDEALRLEPALRPGFAAAITNDEPGVNVFRLNLLAALDAAEHGADVWNHTEVTELLVEEAGEGPRRTAAPEETGSPEGRASPRRRVTGARVRDVLTGETREIRARVTVNACGPWVPRVTAMAGLDYRLRPTKGVHIILDRRVTSVGVAANAIDGRGICLLPHENTCLIGTTDDDFFGDEDDVRATRDEVEYLLRSMETVLPDVGRARVIRVMAGVRPTLYQYGIYEDKVTRDFEVWDHLERDGLDGLITIAGGKMTIARIMAEKTTDAVARRLGPDRAERPCRTADLPLPGGDGCPGPAELERLARRFRVPLAAVGRLATRHGSRTEAVLEEGCRDPGGRRVVCTCEPVLEAEIRYVIRHEFARTLSDIRRRTRLGMGPCQGFGCSEQAAAVLGLERGLDPAVVLADLESFRQERWKGQVCWLAGEQLRQQEVTQGAWLHPEGPEGRAHR